MFKFKFKAYFAYKLVHYFAEPLHVRTRLCGGGDCYYDYTQSARVPRAACNSGSVKMHLLRRHSIATAQL